MTTVPLGPNAEVQIAHVMEDEDPEELVARKLEAAAEGRGWDAPMFIATIFHVQGVGLGAMELPAPPELLNAYPPHALKFLADAIEANTEGIRDFYIEQKYIPRNFVGLFVSTEGWYVPAPLNGTPEYEEWERAVENREMHAHPDRVEMRTSIAFFGPGRLATIMRARGEAPKFAKITDPEDLIKTVAGGRVTVAALRLGMVLNDASEHDEVTL